VTRDHCSQGTKRTSTSGHLSQASAAVGMLIAAMATAYPGTARAEVPLSVLSDVASGRSLAPLLKQVSPAVVGIVTEIVAAPPKGKAAKGSGASSRSSNAFAQQRGRVGSGVIIDAARGLIVTNSHVIEHAGRMTVSLFDDREVEAELVGTDPQTDIAVIKVRAPDLLAIPRGDSGDLQVGDFVLAIEQSPPVGRTVTAGIVSGLHRSNVGLTEAEDFIQTDAAIYPGASGGALIDLHGRLVGINTGFVGSSSTNSGMGFAIPVKLALEVADQILEQGQIRRGRLGIAYGDAATGTRPRTGPTGPVIEKVEAGSVAERAGLKAGDIVSSIDGARVHDTDELHGRLGLVWVGATVELKVWRAGQMMVVHAVMSEATRVSRK
jgi:S1-C subfamily serine protease